MLRGLKENQWRQRQDDECTSGKGKWKTRGHRKIPLTLLSVLQPAARPVTKKQRDVKSYSRVDEGKILLFEKSYPTPNTVSLALEFKLSSRSAHSSPWDSFKKPQVWRVTLSRTYCSCDWLFVVSHATGHQVFWWLRSGYFITLQTFASQWYNIYLNTTHGLKCTGKPHWKSWRHLICRYFPQIISKYKFRSITWECRSVNVLLLWPFSDKIKLSHTDRCHRVIFYILQVLRIDYCLCCDFDSHALLRYSSLVSAYPVLDIHSYVYFSVSLFTLWKLLFVCISTFRESFKMYLICKKIAPKNCKYRELDELWEGFKNLVESFVDLANLSYNT